MADGVDAVSPKESSLAYDEQHNPYENEQTLSEMDWNIVGHHRRAHNKIAFLTDYAAEEVVKITGTITVSF